jgi:hypothetical protein
LDSCIYLQPYFCYYWGFGCIWWLLGVKIELLQSVTQKALLDKKGN